MLAMELWKKKKYAATVRVKTVIMNNLKALSEAHVEKSRFLVSENRGILLEALRLRWLGGFEDLVEG